MTRVGPADPSFEENLARIAAVLQQAEREVGDIRQLSERSFMEWLNAVAQQVATMLGIAAASAAALVADVYTMMKNAGGTFKEAFVTNYQKKRRVQPRRPER